jgi:pimeloyl-ACP methyl ester carboxylesterase
MIVTDELVAQMFTPRRVERQQLPAPRWSETGTLQTPHGALAYWTAGAGPTIVLVHGWEGSHADLDAFVDPFVAVGYRVVSFDNYAHGESESETATLFDMADAVSAIGAHFGPLFAIVAHSVGGPATALALQAGLRAKRVALVSAPTRYEDFVRGFSAAVGIAPQLLLDAIAARGVDVENLVLPTIAKGMTVPALLIHSADDRVTSVDGSEAVANVWPGARFVRVDGLGHNRILRDPATIAMIVDFIVQGSVTE